MPTPHEATEPTALLPLPNLERSEFLIASCQGLHPAWVNLKGRVERTAGLDRQLSNNYQSVYKAMDSLLEELFANMVILGLEATNGTAT
jgi:hypothetical protein